MYIKLEFAKTGTLSLFYRLGACGAMKVPARVPGVKHKTADEKLPAPGKKR